MYNREYPVAASAGAAYDLHIVQADDYGSFWDTVAARSALEHVRALSARKNTLVVLFVHGWHHNAAPDDEDLAEFKRALEALHKELDTPARSALRASVTRQRDLQIVGIYVGWRGRSLPGWLDYLTFWGRKHAAERAGEGDVSEFILRLQRLYLRANASAAAKPDDEPRPLTGLVTIGHSFGGQVLWKAISRQVEDPLGERATCLADVLDPLDGARGVAVRRPLDALGDLNILVNPALEAYQYARVDALSRQLAYPPDQTPQLIIFSAENDKARKIWFPLARYAGSPFRPRFRPELQGLLYGRALGELASQRTHVLVKAAPGSADSLGQEDYGNVRKILEFDFTDDTVFGGIELKPVVSGPSAAGRVAFSPVLVAQTQDDIVDGHNGIFGEDFRSFLTKYISFIEGKRLLLREFRRISGGPPARNSEASAGCETARSQAADERH